ncbi:MAG TPA: Rho termination factor N-terminal domain-containing protein [Solirubrobacteraceae bacterium]|jgi:transcription termination factor Rho|nr:Rho termination factor N-terminal domain-containing protein [Solirubrobacteraceae bacterium]
MTVLDRDALEGSPLADLHAIASELSIDGFRRLRKADLIDRIIARQDGRADAEDAGTDAGTAAEEGEEPTPGSATETAEEGPASGRRRRSRRGGRGRTQPAGAESEGAEENGEETPEPEAESEKPPSRSRRGERPGRTPDSGRGGDSGRSGDKLRTEESAPEEVVEGVVELLGNGSGFVRTSPPDPSEQDVYISAAQVKRCELVSGDRVSGPKRPPRRSERFASLVRVDTVNGRPASELSEGARYDELPSAFPADRFRFGSEDPTLKAIEFLTPFGRGSRVVIAGGPRAGKSFALRNLAEALAAVEGIQLFVALAGVRPEELAEWPREGALTPSGALSFAASPDALDHVVELVVDQAKRIAARGADAVVIIDTLDGLHPQAAHKALAAARNIVDGGSLTVIATSSRPLGGETTVIALDPLLTAAGRLPALDLVASGTTRAELLVGEAGAQAIAEARAQALDSAS